MMLQEELAAKAATLAELTAALEAAEQDAADKGRAAGDATSSLKAAQVGSVGGMVRGPVSLRSKELGSSLQQQQCLCWC